MSTSFLSAVILAAIVLPDNPTEVERGAADELRGAVAEITGADMEIVSESAAAGGPGFYIGATRRAKPRIPARWRPDEVLVAADGGDVVLAGHPDRGPFYAVDVYLEDVCGVRWWTSTESTYPRLAAMPLPAAEIRHAPKFAYRETYYLDGFTNALFKVRSKGNFSSRTRYMFHDLEPVPARLGGDHRLYFYKGRRSAYHSFFEVLPPAKHFADHPEWYSLVGGKRVAKQLCLVNEEMKRAYIDETLRLLAEDPSVDFISVSQNDWKGSCECAGCRAVIEEEGATSGLYLRFANAVAEAVEKVHPRVRVDTFAYQFTVKPPKKTRPRDNVVVRLCSFKCGVNERYERGRLDDGFSKNLAAWSEIAAGRLFVWDYAANFWSYMLPHPNIRSMAPNVRLFARRGAVGVFEQGDAMCSAGTLAAFRHWYLSHLLWNPEADEGRLRAEFMRGYYGGRAAPFMDRYVDVLEDCAARFAAAGGKITCGHSDVADFMSREDAEAAAAAMSNAVAAARADGVRFERRVLREKLSLDHAFILNFDRWRLSGSRADAVERFAEGCRDFGVEALRETVDRGMMGRYLEKLRKSAAEAASARRVVSFKDAAKIKTWDAWNDHKGPHKWKERPCITWKKLNSTDPGLRRVGTLRTRTAKEIRSSRWSVGCETLDRDYADWDQYKRFLGELGAKRGRLFSGWAKTEQEKGKYDFTWLDPQVREMAAMGVKPWICISYGNPVWGSDFRLGMRVRQVTDSPEAFAAWLRYVKALVERYKDVVDEWEVWNEPFGQRDEYAKMFYETARVVKSVQPGAKCIVTALNFGYTRDPSKNEYRAVAEKLKAENALGLATHWVFHPYCANPDWAYLTYEESDAIAESNEMTYQWRRYFAPEFKKFLEGYSKDWKVLQGEVGCPAQLEFAHALNGIEWTEYSQAKWNLRLQMGAAVREIPSNLFTFIDLQYTFMLQSFGLIRSNTLKEPVYRRPSFYAMRNFYSVFDDDVSARGFEKRRVGGRELSVARFSRLGRPFAAVWFSGERPGDSLSYEPVDLSFLAADAPSLWIDLMTGRAYALDGLSAAPVWDSPVILAGDGTLELR